MEREYIYAKGRGQFRNRPMTIRALGAYFDWMGRVNEEFHLLCSVQIIGFDFRFFSEYGISCYDNNYNNELILYTKTIADFHDKFPAWEKYILHHDCQNRVFIGFTDHLQKQ